jgi:DNA-binding transcriptional regulator WhiA|tara:strand:+ start:398 stop:703 length:306 start_codon:yes stop_codon:yes gene_type:complete
MLAYQSPIVKDAIEEAKQALELRMLAYNTNTAIKERKKRYNGLIKICERIEEMNERITMGNEDMSFETRKDRRDIYLSRVKHELTQIIRVHDMARLITSFM